MLPFSSLSLARQAILPNDETWAKLWVSQSDWRASQSLQWALLLFYGPLRVNLACRLGVTYGGFEVIMPSQ